jgi:hypothetical protein
VGSLGRALGAVEFFGTVLVLILLIGGLIARRRRRTPVVVVAVVFGIVFANPLGVITRQSATDPRPMSPSMHADGARHWVKIAGVPVAWFTPYNEEYVHAGWYENVPTSALKLRYGISFLPSTGASTVVGQCSNSISDPCWRGRPEDYPLVHHDHSGNTWIVPLGEAPRPDVSGEWKTVHVPQFYEVGFGLASTRALVYWLSVACVIGVMAAQSRFRWADVGRVAAGCVGVGVVLAVVLAVVPMPARSADSQSPELLPKAADTPKADATLSAAVISDEPYGASCVAREGNTTHYRCRRALELTAVENRGAILAIWTSQPSPAGLTQLRVRRLSLAGVPLGSSSPLLQPWPGENPPGSGNCNIPVDLQAAPLIGGDVLIAWSNSCGRGTTEPASINGVVVDGAGKLVRGPFVVAEFARGPASTAPLFWLRSTSAAETVLVRTGPSRTNPYFHSLFASVLNDRQRAEMAKEVVALEHDEIGSVAVACGKTCVVAHGLQGMITFTFLSSRGDVERESSIEQGQAAFHSMLTATAVADGFVIGWLESEGVNVDARIATVRAGRAPSVATVGKDIPNGGVHPTIPQPLGIAVRRTAPALIWQGVTYVEGKLQLRLYFASSTGKTANALDLILSESTIAGEDTLVAVASSQPIALPDAVSVAVP